jgi:hypothetical protein
MVFDLAFSERRRRRRSERKSILIRLKGSSNSCERVHILVVVLDLAKKLFEVLKEELPCEFLTLAPTPHALAVAPGTTGEDSGGSKGSW